MRKRLYLDLTSDYIDRQERLRRIQKLQPTISSADLVANLFVLVGLVAWCVYLIMG